MNRGPEPGHASSKPRFTQKQGQYLAFIHAYTLVLGRPPAEADLRRHFRVTPPSVHQMLITREREGLIRRQPGIARSIQLLIDPSTLPPLLPSQHQSVKTAVHRYVPRHSDFDCLDVSG
jgi:Mn-dependent DtxR family transcriptional regulator